MNLEEINEEYVKLKQDIKDKTEKVGKLERNVKIIEGQLAQAQVTGNKSQEENCKKQLAKIKEDAEKEKSELTNAQTKIDARIAQIKANPEMRKHLEAVMATRYTRERDKKEAERAKLANKRYKTEIIAKLIKEHPALGNNIKGMISANEEHKRIKMEINKIKDIAEHRKGGMYTPDEETRINDLKNKLNDNKDKFHQNETNLMNFIKKNDIHLEKEDIEELTRDKVEGEDGKKIALSKVIRDKDGQIDLETMLNKNTKTLNKQINGYDKQLANYDIMLGAEGLEVEQSEESLEEPESNMMTDYYEKKAEAQENLKRPNIFKRIFNKVKGWFERKPEQLPGGEPEQEEHVSEAIDTEFRNSDDNQFKDSLKYEIMQDITKDIRDQDLKEASQIRRQKAAEQRNQNNDNQER